MYKNLAQLSYLTPLGLVIAAILHEGRAKKQALDTFHIRQSLALCLLLLLAHIVSLQFDYSIFYAEPISLLFLIPFFILWILGFSSAATGKEKPLPIIGRMAQRVFAFIK